MKRGQINLTYALVAVAAAVAAVGAGFYLSSQSPTAPPSDALLPAASEEMPENISAAASVADTCEGGDFDFDGDIDHADLSELEAIIDAVEGDGRLPEGTDMGCADINGDGTVTFDDQDCMAGLLVGLYGSQPECSQCLRESECEICHDGVDNDCDGQTDKDTYDQDARAEYAADLCDCNEDTLCSMTYDIDGVPGGTDKLWCRYVQGVWDWVKCAKCGRSDWCESRGYDFDSYSAGATSECAHEYYICNDKDEWAKCGSGERGDTTVVNGVTLKCKSTGWLDVSACTQEGQTQDCDTGLPGICSAGTQRCLNGQWTTCQSDEYPGHNPEACENGLDDDCDGKVDWDDESCGRGAFQRLAARNFFKETASNPHVLHISGNTYAVVFTSTLGGSKAQLYLLKVKDDGSIPDKPIIDKKVIAEGTYNPDIVKVSGDVYAISHYQFNGGMHVTTVKITASGIQKVIKTKSWDSSVVHPNAVRIYHVSGNYFALVYAKDHQRYGTIKTIKISSDGTSITNVDEFRFSNKEVYGPKLTKVNDKGLYAVVYEFVSGDGKVGIQTVNIDSKGKISDTGQAQMAVGPLSGPTHGEMSPHIINAPKGSDFYAVAFSVWNSNPHFKTFKIYNSGKVIAAPGEPNGVSMHKDGSYTNLAYLSNKKIMVIISTFTDVAGAKQSEAIIKVFEVNERNGAITKLSTTEDEFSYKVDSDIEFKSMEFFDIDRQEDIFGYVAAEGNFGLHIVTFGPTQS